MEGRRRKRHSDRLDGGATKKKALGPTFNRRFRTHVVRFLTPVERNAPPNLNKTRVPRIELPSLIPIGVFSWRRRMERGGEGFGDDLFSFDIVCDISLIKEDGIRV